MIERALNPVLEKVVQKIYDKYPVILQKYGEEGKKKCYEDNLHHLRYLDSAYSVKNSNVFADYACWLNSVLVSRGMKPDHLIDNFIFLGEAIEENQTMEKERREEYLSYLKNACNGIEEQS
ncbi:hypothetical protein [Falsibacillus albus]|uniref:Uncharacterized protein n=1 Tax=Falsibacillus albus TaxID=2478915 RepID=A0A3L7K460_9BACI|nr:hypothetical protein [Falsibacillus albus]RLQ95502.1 hypothetical protein D9X91_10750 [Falsibacillus albus]